MLELSLKGGKAYWCWITLLLTVVAIGIITYMRQYQFGLGITGLSRDISWGFYIVQLTFLVGVAASAVMVVLSYYLHDYKAFGKLTVIGEFTAVASVSMCGLFLFVDIGQPARALNVFLYPPPPQSIVFWDSIVRRNVTILPITCVALFIGTWIDKGIGLITGGFVPTPLHRVKEYIPTLPELTISTGIFAVGLLMLTILLKMVIVIRTEN